MKSHEIRRAYIDFFTGKDHAEINSASLIPEHDPTVLFTTAGMHPLVPFLIGEPHPSGKRLVNYQKCVRTDDIDEVGDESHLTFFEMLGNWSLGDYFKKEAIEWSWEFLTRVLVLDPKHLYITCYEGDDVVPRDTEAAGHWEEVGVPNTHIFFFGKKENWWGPAGQTGPCGPDTEMHYDIRTNRTTPITKDDFAAGNLLEIWNDVFMQYNKTSTGTYEPLAQKNVDTGMGLERITTLLQGVHNVFDTDLFEPIMRTIIGLQKTSDIRSQRIVADHLRAAVFMMADGAFPSNVDQGYVVRRLIRRAVRHGKKLGIDHQFTHTVAETVISTMGDVYPELKKKKDEILEGLVREEEQFKKTLERGLREFEKLAGTVTGTVISGTDAFHLYDTYGFPIEFTEELAKERSLTVDRHVYDHAFEKHQELSRAGAEKKFHGGLADHQRETVRLHTATHLMHQALKDVLGNQVNQKGSNITSERLRFDFNYDTKLTPEQITQVESIVNEKIKADLPIHWEEMTVEEAKKRRAIGLFEERYGEKVKIYIMGDYSIEVCGGPHVEHTGELESFRIVKEESCGKGMRRIKATVGANQTIPRES